MGNTDQFDDPKSEPQRGPVSELAVSPGEPPNGVGPTDPAVDAPTRAVESVASLPPSAVTDTSPLEHSTNAQDDGWDEFNEAVETSSLSLPPSDKPITRRSSLKPAPPSFRPSARNPSELLRPAMVVHAGDVDAKVPIWDVSDPAPSHPSHSSAEAPRPEPFALADDFCPTEAQQAPAGTAPKPPTNVTTSNIAASSRTNSTGQSVTSRKPAATSRTARNTLSHFGAPNRQSKPLAAQIPMPAGGPVSASKTDQVQVEPARSHVTRAHLTAVLAALILAGVVVTMMLVRTNGASTSVAAQPTAQGERLASSLPVADEPVNGAERAMVAGNSAPAAGSLSAASKSEANPPENPSASAAAASAVDSPKAEPAGNAQSPNSTRVALEIVPSDARVIQQGRLQPPPYVFDVPKGKRLTLELVRFGFVTQKVVLDGKRSVVKIGLRRAPNTHGRAD